MGFLDGIRAFVDPVPTYVRQEAEDVSAISEALYALMAERKAAFTLADARRLPPVIRATTLITSVAASMQPLVYRNGAALELQPRIVRKPDPFRSRWQFVSQSVDSLLEDGCAFWLLTDHDGGYPRSATVLPHDEVNVQWDSRRFLPEYQWRGRSLVRDVEIKHVTINHRAGELHGRGPLREGLDYLYPIHAAEHYAGDFFASGGLPETVLQSLVPIKEPEAKKLKRQYVESRSGPEPVVLPPDVKAEFPATDPQKAQMQESRAYGATIVSRLLGIPGALMHVETSGATITYQNPAGAIEELVKTTVAPTYLAPIEAALSELVPAPQSVRFDLADLQRADMAARFVIYGTAIDKGIMTPEEARAFEGWAPEATEAAHQFDPIPEVPPTIPIEVPL